MYLGGCCRSEAYWTSIKPIIFFSQGSQMLVHKLHDKQLEVFTHFMACFIKAEHLSNMHPKALAELDFTDKMLPAREIYVGREADEFRNHKSCS